MTTTCSVGPQVEMYYRCDGAVIYDHNVHCSCVCFLEQVNLSTRLIQYYGPQKNKLSCGVQALQLLPNGRMLLGSGEGTLAILLPSLKRSRFTTIVSGAISSIALSKDASQVHVYRLHVLIIFVCLYTYISFYNIMHSSMWELAVLSDT